jgi:hypothetical protein
VYIKSLDIERRIFIEKDQTRMYIANDERPSSGNIFPRRTDKAYCIACDKPVDLLGFQASADLFNTDRQDIEFLAGQAAIHRIHNRHGEVMICAASLFAVFDERPTRLLDSHFTHEIEKSFERKGPL